ncbi:T4-like proximal tail fiber [Candidatus Scalindua japonica]|uniref:T4-like proximal tail fiber n=1 Tax=Candidatus Scalindua japonica TaxID=1284222 RepID=A0A286TTX9_9BACT|nr:hypothetical protein [Candidatus Scalindua japonica]GAX59311.1 T4-like proximal tail fiber [Candidatus Scalindua japonica]
MLKLNILAGFCALVLCVSSVVYAADTEVVLEGNTSASGFLIKNEADQKLMEVRGHGIITMPGHNVKTDEDDTSNTFLGINAGQNTALITNGGRNVAIGSLALVSNTIGRRNVAIGHETMRENISGNENTAIGLVALASNTIGAQNTAVGIFSLSSNTEGSHNTAIGWRSLFFNTEGKHNAATGYQALYKNISGDENTASGLNALYNNTTGIRNAAFGAGALVGNTTGNFNTAIGYGAGINATGTGNTFIGYQAGSSHTTGDNKLYIAKGNNTLIYGDFGTGSVGINTTTPNAGAALDVNGAIFQSGVSLHADYVFESDYKLESIKEHAEFMWNNKHLAAVPKAKVNEDGMEVVEVGAHRKGIVEELEKAHIYIEQLHEHNKKLEERLAKIEARLNGGL